RAGRRPRLMPSVDEILAGKEVCICAGSGGVGKTTTSAAIATGLAAQGNEAKRVDPALFQQHGIEMKGELWAMMLDAKETFDDLVRRHAPDEETRDRILSNRIYQQLSAALAGSQEY